MLNIDSVKELLSKPKVVLTLNSLIGISLLVVINYYVYTNYNVPLDMLMEPLLLNTTLFIGTYLAVIALHKFFTWGTIDEEYQWDPQNQT